MTSLKNHSFWGHIWAIYKHIWSIYGPHISHIYIYIYKRHDKLHQTYKDTNCTKHIWPYMAIYGHTYVQILSYIWPYMAICIWPYIVIYWPYMAIYGHIWPYICPYIVIHMAIYGHIKMAIYGHIWSCIWPFWTIFGHIWPHIYITVIYIYIYISFMATYTPSAPLCNVSRLSQCRNTFLARSQKQSLHRSFVSLGQFFQNSC